MNALDPKFAKVVALMRSTQHAGERSAARARAEAMAASAGMSLDDAIAASEAPKPTPYVNIMTGFDDWMEKREPGWKAQRAAEKSEKERQRLKRRAAILKCYGSEEAALAPCRLEQLLRDALGDKRKPCEPPFERWTYAVDGYRSLFDDLPDTIRHIVTHAYPMPTTFPKALTEYEYWHARRQEIEDVLGLDGYGDSGLDLIPEIRFDLVRNLVEREVEAKTIGEIYARFKFYRDLECRDDKIEDALFRDLEALVTKGHLSDASTEDDPSGEKRRSDSSGAFGQVGAALSADPSRSDRDIARRCGCSPTTVGKVRRKLGLTGAERSVQRGGQMYQMRFHFEGCNASAAREGGARNGN